MTSSWFADKIERWPTEKLLPYARNARTHSEDQVAQIAASIAAEKSGRQGRLIELDPKYVDVAVKRWQNFTGKDATLEATGETFNAALDARS